MKLVRTFWMPVIMIVMMATACKKAGPCEALVTVIDSLGKRVQGATVVLRQDSVINPTNGSQGAINEVGITNSSGQAYFTFKLEAVLILEAIKGTKSARDYLRLEQGEQVAKTVVIR